MVAIISVENVTSYDLIYLVFYRIRQPRLQAYQN